MSQSQTVKLKFFLPITHQDEDTESKIFIKFLELHDNCVFSLAVPDFFSYHIFYDLKKKIHIPITENQLHENDEKSPIFSMTHSPFL